MLKAKRRPWRKFWEKHAVHVFFFFFDVDSSAEFNLREEACDAKKSLGGSQITVLVVACFVVIIYTLLLY